MGTRTQLCTLFLLSAVMMVGLVPTAKADTLNLASTPNSSMTFTPPTVFFNGTAAVSTSGSGVFAAIPVGTPGVVSTMNIGSEPVGSTFSPVTFVTIGGFTFSLTSINAGSYSSASCGLPAAVGQTCTPNVPPDTYVEALNLENVNLTTYSLSFSFAGNVTGPGIVGSEGFTGVLSTQASGSFQSFLNSLNTNGSVTLPYSMVLTTTPPTSPVPEPGSFVLLGTGLAGIAGTLKRKLKIRR